MTERGWGVLENYLSNCQTSKAQPWSDSQARMYKMCLDFLPDNCIMGLCRKLAMSYDWLPTPRQIALAAGDILFGSIPPCEEAYAALLEACDFYTCHRYDRTEKYVFSLDQVLEVLTNGAPARRRFGKMLSAIRPNPVIVPVLSAMGGMEAFSKSNASEASRLFTQLYAEAVKSMSNHRAESLSTGDYRWGNDGLLKLGVAVSAESLMLAASPLSENQPDETKENL